MPCRGQFYNIDDQFLHPVASPGVRTGIIFKNDYIRQIVIYQYEDLL